MDLGMGMGWEVMVSGWVEGYTYVYICGGYKLHAHAAAAATRLVGMRLEQLEDVCEVAGAKDREGVRGGSGEGATLDGKSRLRVLDRGDGGGKALHQALDVLAFAVSCPVGGGAGGPALAGRSPALGGGPDWAGVRACAHVIDAREGEDKNGRVG